MVPEIDQFQGRMPAASEPKPVKLATATPIKAWRLPNCFSNAINVFFVPLPIVGVGALTFEKCYDL
jgi:hypothetical protein